MKIKPIKGRPMLDWVGKRPIDTVPRPDARVAVKIIDMLGEETVVVE